MDLVKEINNMILEGDYYPDSVNATSHRVVSPKQIFATNKEEIKNLINKISKQHNISPEDAAFGLTNLFKNYVQVNNFS